MIFCKTTIGFGSPNKSGTADVHGAALGEEELEKTREALGWKYPSFEVPQEVYEFWDSKESGANINSEWDSLIKKYEEDYLNESQELHRRINGDLPIDFQQRFIDFLENL